MKLNVKKLFILFGVTLVFNIIVSVSFMLLYQFIPYNQFVFWDILFILQIIFFIVYYFAIGRNIKDIDNRVLWLYFLISTVISITVYFIYLNADFSSVLLDWALYGASNSYFSFDLIFAGRIPTSSNTLITFLILSIYVFENALRCILLKIGSLDKKC